MDPVSSKRQEWLKKTMKNLFKLYDAVQNDSSSTMNTEEILPLWLEAFDTSSLYEQELLEGRIGELWNRLKPHGTSSSNCSPLFPSYF